jgi:glycosyltransferase involved in cell wall biosynthesis
MIITGTQAGKDEIVHYYRVNPANVIVIPLPVPAAPPMAPQRAGVEIKQRYGLNGDFLLYPAQSWPHKNHVNLVRGLQILRDQSDLDLSLVLTGSDKGNLGHVMEEI